MEHEINETLFGWKITRNEPELRDFNLNENERRLAGKLISTFFLSIKTVEIETLLRRHCEATLEPLPQKSFSKITTTCNSLLNGVGPVQVLLEGDVEEVSLSLGTARVFKRRRGWEDTALEITSDKYLQHVVNKLASQCGRRLTIENPVLNAFLSDGTRIHAVAPPVSNTLNVSIRKLREVPFTLQQLVGEELLSQKSADFLQRSVANKSILIAGNTGSGKTTTLNALLSLLPKSDRFVFVEDVSELTLPTHANKARLLADAGKVTLADLTYEALRMRPDRLVVSEIRSEAEVKAFANALLSGGGKTCYATFHASSAKEALRRLRLLGFKKADLDSIGLIVVQKRIDDEKTGREKRRITEIATVKNGEVNVIRL